MTDEIVKLLSGEPIEAATEDLAFEKIAAQEPRVLRQLARHLLGERRQLRGELAKAKVAEEKAKSQSARAKAMLDGVLQPPLQPAVVLRVCASGQLDVATNGGRQIVAVHPKLATTRLRSGEEVYLDPETGIAVRRGEDGPRLGRVATVAERVGDRVMVRGEADEDRLVLCDPSIVGEIELGDRVLISREVPCVLERLPSRRESLHLLHKAPRVSFDDIGGLDELVDELRREFELHLFRPELVKAYAMPLMRGMTLVGPPGVGKTLVARAVARFLADAAPDTRFGHVAPGSLRGSYYGQTEERIRNLFRAARSEPGIAVLFFDELDSFGARGASPGHEIDDRVMGTLLSEIDGLEESDGIFVIGATNRLELIDDAILRQGRFGDRIVDIPRPNRAATRAILERLLAPGLPWAEDAAPASAVAAAVSFLHAPEGAAGPVVRVTFPDGTKQDVRARDVVSGALLASSVREAKKAAALRQLDHGSGLCEADVIEALDRSLGAEARKLSSVVVARRSLSLPRSQEIVGVEVPPERGIGVTAQLRAA